MFILAVKPASGLVPSGYVPTAGPRPFRVKAMANFPSVVAIPMLNRPADGTADEIPLYEPAEPPVNVAVKLEPTPAPVRLSLLSPPHAATAVIIESVTRMRTAGVRNRVKIIGIER